ncbi:MAG: hypothetical protein I3273_04940 [Candidatus Moeniiplasma glomeromycotorum]|nr:hypothetical protein [Candidatus Moeniiplasma glomeromycotorum]MCE8167888.1 hypothetical protein [Candidatus Moeniiplasma glomeromycotorum]MCE8169438.1 hypothetical protein [Candidatus Moeniiplasma glomeromycotorum]
MICYTCDKFIKKGHGKNTYYYAGEWRYYCFFCLKWNIVIQRITERNKSYFTWISFLTLMLSALIYSLTIWQINKNISENIEYFSWLALFLGSLPIVGAIILWLLIIKPKLNKLAKKDRKPLLKEQNKLIRMENYVYSLKRGKDFCHCEKCLIAEWEKRN